MSRIIILTLMISLVSAGITIFNHGASNFDFLYILPLSLLLFTIVFSKALYSLQNSFVFKIFWIQIIIRYCILPISLSSGYNFTNGYYSNNLNTAVLVMLIELTLAYSVLYFIHPVQKNSYKLRNKNIANIQNVPFAIVLLLLIFLFLYQSGTLSRVSLIWELGEYISQRTTDSNKSESSSLAAVLLSTFISLLQTVLVSIIYFSNKIKAHIKTYLYLIVLVCSSIFIIGVSRFSTVLSAIPLMIFILQLTEKKYANRIKYIFTTTFIFLLLLASIEKFSRQSEDENLSAILNPATLNSYFSGPGNIAVGIDTYERSNYSFYESILFLLNDTIQNIVMLSKLSIPEYSLNNIFNFTIYGHNYWSDQIVPVSISGLFHLGYIGIPFYTSLFLILAFYFERKSYNASKLVYRYPLIIISVTFSLVFMMNISSIYSTFTNTILFIIIPFFFIQKFPNLKK